MVQLRAFRYIGEVDESTSQQDQINIAGDSSNSSSGSMGSSEAVDGGGNLTSDESESTRKMNLGQPEVKETNNRRTKANNQREQTISETSNSEQSGSMEANSSIEELQESRLELGQETESDKQKDESEETKSGRLEAEEALDQVPNDVAEIRPPMRLRSGSASAAVGPLASRKLLLQQLGGVKSMGGSPSPLVARWREGMLASADSVSQYSFGQRQISGNHFEIRWQNIRLKRRRQSALPNEISRSNLYKRLFSRGPGWEEERQREVDLKDGISICWSPPIRRRMMFWATSGPCPPTPKRSSGQTTPTGVEKMAQFEMSGYPPSPAGSPKVNSLYQHPVYPTAAGSLAPLPPPTSGSIVLDGVSGSVFSGQMTAILGPSGVGKTSLLNSLTGRNQLSGSGRVHLLGATNRKRMSVVTVPQTDVLPGKLTVWEDLMFTSRLKNPGSNCDHKRYIDRIVQHLHMSSFLHNRIDKLSGGEARRLSIGRELLSSPDIVILDEPTSGLDANTCKKIVAALRDITEHSDNILDRPMSIIVTIHQPQKEVLDLFHRLYVMAIGGKVIYEGPPTGMLQVMVDQSSLGRLTAGEQLNDNPAIVALEVASGEYGSAVINELSSYHRLTMGYTDHLDGSLPGQQQQQGWSPFQTPKTPRTPRVGGLRHSSSLGARLSSLGGGIGPPIAPDLGSLGRPTPNLGYRRKFSSQLTDPLAQSVASISYASTWDLELPEETSPDLKVDKRLRRSVVMHGDFFSHTWTLMQRCWIMTTRDLFLMSIRIIGFILVAGGMVQIFHHALDPNEHMCPDFLSEINDISSFMETSKDRLLNMSELIQQQRSTHLFFFQLILSLMMVTAALSGLVFPLQMRMFLREQKNGWYSSGPFVLSQTLAELPADMIGPVISIVISYQLCQQPSSEYHWREIGYVIVAIVGSLVCKSQAQLIAGFLMDSVENSVFMSCVSVVFPALLSGISVKIKNMSEFLQVASYGSFLRYVFDSLFILRFGFGICPCDRDEVGGFPVRLAPETVPDSLRRMAHQYIDLSSNGTTAGSNNQTSDPKDGEMFDRMLRLISDANNLFLPNQTDLGDCSKSRSLYLVELGIDDSHLFKWMMILGAFFIVSRLMIYIAVRIIIKIRR